MDTEYNSNAKVASAKCFTCPRKISAIPVWFSIEIFNLGYLSQTSCRNSVLSRATGDVRCNRAIDFSLFKINARVGSLTVHMRIIHLTRNKLKMQTYTTPWFFACWSHCQVDFFFGFAMHIGQCSTPQANSVGRPGVWRTLSEWEGAVASFKTSNIVLSTNRYYWVWRYQNESLPKQQPYHISEPNAEIENNVV